MHLIRRLLEFLFARPLTPKEQQQVRNLLEPELAGVFFAQRPEDQRHAFGVLERVGESRELAEAALLHDVGKIHSDLGALSRSMATLWGGLGLSASGSWSSYLNHGPLGGEMLRELHATDLAVAFSEFHPGYAPPGIDSSQWQLLEDADNA